jgi:hypothetical protein
LLRRVSGDVNSQDKNHKIFLNSKSDYAKYMELNGAMRSQLTALTEKIKPKGMGMVFLKE